MSYFAYDGDLVTKQQPIMIGLFFFFFFKTSGLGIRFHYTMKQKFNNHLKTSI